MNQGARESGIEVPRGKFCSNCASGCIYWDPRNKDGNGRQYCSHYDSYYYPRERNGCLSFKS
jgi:hypothetical protein